MTSMIEQLMSNPLARPDEKLPIPDSALPPERPRDFFSTLASFGEYASRKTLQNHIDFQITNLHALTYSVLNRPPTAQEMDAVPPTRRLHAYMFDLMRSQEFRLSLTQRIFEAFPDRRRLLWVYISGCRHAPLLDSFGAVHPLIPTVPRTPRISPDDFDKMLPALGKCSFKIRASSTILSSARRLEYFLRAPGQPGKPGDYPWILRGIPLRSTDTVSTLITDPLTIALGYVQDTIDQIRIAPAASPMAAWRQAAGLDADSSDAAYLDQADQLIAQFVPQNPLCVALGTGTKDSAVALCREANLELADMNQADNWIASHWDMDVPDEFLNFPLPPKLTDLPAPAQARLSAMIDEDKAFYDLFMGRIKAAGWLSVKGTALA